MASNDLAKLVVRLEAQTAEYDKKLEQATRKLRTFGSQQQTILGFIDSNFKKLAAGVTVVALTRFIKGSIDTADAAGKMAQQIGTTTEAISRLNYAAKLGDVEQDELAGALKRLAANAFDASRGVKTAQDTFKALGVSVRDASGNLKPVDQIFLDISDSVSRYADGTAKTALVQDAMGKSAASLIPLLNGGRAAFKAAADESDRLGNTISDKTAKAADRFNDAMDRLQLAVRGLGLQLAQALLPHLEDLAKKVEDQQFQLKLAETAKGIATIAEAAFNAVAKVAEFANAIRFLGEAAKASLKGPAVGDMVRIEDALFKAQETLRIASEKGYSQVYLNSLKAEIAALEHKKKLTEEVLKLSSSAPKPDGPPPPAVVPPPLPQLIVPPAVDDAAKKRLDQLKQLNEALHQQFEELGLNEKQITLRKIAVLGGTAGDVEFAAAVFDATEKLEQQNEKLKLVAETIEQTQTPIEKLRQEITELNQLRLDGSLPDDSYRKRVQQLQDSFDEASKKAKESGEMMQEYWKEAARNMQDAFAEFLFDPFKDGLDGLLTNFVDVLRRMAAQAAAAQIFQAIGSWGKENAGAEGWIGTLATLAGSFGGGKAAGGPVSSGTPYWVGERGPEMFVPNVGGMIVPHEKSMAAAGSGDTHVHFHGVTDFDSFKKSKSQWMSDVSVALARSRSRNG